MKIASLAFGIVVAYSAPLMAGDVVFADDFETGDTSGWWAPARVGATGQVTCYNTDGDGVYCQGTGQDGDLRPGVAWPNPRFVDNGDGTVVDMLTGLYWLRAADCFGQREWADALADANTLASGACGLTDGSAAGDWRLPSRFELESLLDLEISYPALSNAAGTSQWTEGDAFSDVQTNYYWSSTSRAGIEHYAWVVTFTNGFTTTAIKLNAYFVWPVRNELSPPVVE